MFEPIHTPSALDPAIINYYIAKGRRERSRAIKEMVLSLFSAPAPAPASAKTADCAA